MNDTEILKSIAIDINYPATWDTVAYPTLISAICELWHWSNGESQDVVATKLVEEHWKYIDALLQVYGIKTTGTEEYHYKTAFIHGYKHGKKGLE